MTVKNRREAECVGPEEVIMDPGADLMDSAPASSLPENTRGQNDLLGRVLAGRNLYQTTRTLQITKSLTHHKHKQYQQQS